MAKQALVYDTGTGKVEGVGGSTSQVLTRNSSSNWVAADQPYDVSGEYPGTIAGNEEIAHFIAVRPFTIKQHTGTNLSQAFCGVSPSGGAVQFTITYYPVGGGASSTIGTFSFAATTGTVTFSIGADKTFAAGDRFIITAPATTYSIETVYWTLFAVVA